MTTLWFIFICFSSIAKQAIKVM